MNCNEFIFPLLSVRLLEHGKDIFYHIPANIEGCDSVVVESYNTDVPSSTAYAVLVHSASGEYGELLISNPESYKLTNQQSTKVSGYNQKVSLEYTYKKEDDESLQEFANQQHKLRQNFYSLLLEFFDGSYGLVRTHSHGDNFNFSSKSQNGETTNVITIHNTHGIQLLTIAPHS